MFVSFSETLQASSEATITRSAIPGSDRVLEAAHMPCHELFASGHFVRCFRS